MNRRYLILPLILLGSILGCGGDSSPTAPTATLTVIVHELNPPVFTRIPGAAVSIQGKAAVTNANGECRFTNLTTGPATLSLAKEGFRSREQPITLLPGENTTSQEMLP